MDKHLTKLIKRKIIKLYTVMNEEKITGNKVVSRENINKLIFLKTSKNGEILGKIYLTIGISQVPNKYK